MPCSLLCKTQSHQTLSQLYFDGQIHREEPDQYNGAVRFRSLKSFDSAKALLEGFAIHYNHVRAHQSLDNKTPAQVSRIEAPNIWKALIEQATKYEAELYAKVTQQKPNAQAKQEKPIEVIAK